MLAAVDSPVDSPIGDAGSARNVIETTAEVLAFRARVLKTLVVDDVGSIRKLLPARLKRINPEMVRPHHNSPRHSHETPLEHPG